MRLIDAEELENDVREKIGYLYGATKFIKMINEQPTIEAKPVVHAHWISASWEEDEEDGIENTYSDEFICSKCKEHLYFPDAIEKEDIEFSFCPYCGAQMDENHIAEDGKKEPICGHPQEGVKIPVISMEDIPKILDKLPEVSENPILREVERMRHIEK